MKRIKGQEIVETADSQEPDIRDMRSVKRQVDVGYKRWLLRRGLPLPFGMRAEVNAGMAEAVAEKRKRGKS